MPEISSPLPRGEVWGGMSQGSVPNPIPFDMSIKHFKGGKMASYRVAERDDNALKTTTRKSKDLEQQEQWAAYKKMKY